MTCPIGQEEYDFALAVAKAMMRDLPAIEAEDVAVEAVEKALNRFVATFSPAKGRWQTFLFSLTKTEAKRALWRWRRKHHQIEAQEAKTFEELPIDLPPDLQALAQGRIEGKTWGEIMKDSGMSRRTFEKARNRLKRILEGHDPD